jgi:hypothetical protein
VHGINDVREREVDTGEQLIPKPSYFEVQIHVEELKRYKSPGTDRIPTELIQVGGNTLSSEIHRLIHSIWNK